MEKGNRIPAIPGKSRQELESWFATLHAADLLFHPDDSPEDIVSIATDEPTFTPAECLVLRESLAKLFEYHGDEVYEVALVFFHKAIDIDPTYSAARPI